MQDQKKQKEPNVIVKVKPPSKKIYFEKEKIIQDEKGNTIAKEHEIKSIDAEQEPPFVKVYLKDIIWLTNNPKWINKVLGELLKNMGYGNEIILNTTLRKRYAKSVGITLNSFNKALSNLKKSNILLSKEKGIYIANPELFAKGRWEQIKTLKMEISYTKDGSRSIKTTIEDEESTK